MQAIENCDQQLQCHQPDPRNYFDVHQKQQEIMYKAHCQYNLGLQYKKIFNPIKAREVFL